MSVTYNNRYQFLQKGSPDSESICWDPHLERKVVINWLWSASEETAVRSCLERLLAVQSPNVIDVYDLAKHGNQLGVVHEHCEGAPLAAALPAASAAPVKALYQAASAIAHLSAAKVNMESLGVHNFCYTQAGILKLAHLEREMLSKSANPHPDDLRHVHQVASALFQAHTNLPQRIIDALSSPADPGQRARSAADLAALAAAHLVRDMHRAVLTHQGRVVELNAARRRVSLAHPSGIAQVELTYDGLEFRVTAVTGEASINNQPVIAGNWIPDACVIALGGPSLPSYQRQFVTMDLSHPGVVL